MLSNVVTADGSIDKRPREDSGVVDVEEIGDVEGGVGTSIEDADGPATFGEAAIPGADVALGVRVHGLVARVPEEPNVFLIFDGGGSGQIPVDLGIWTGVELVEGDLVNSVRE